MATAKQKLIIVESPAKAKTIGKYLGKGYKVEASQGHICDLPKSQLGIDVDHDFDLKYITIRGRGDILSRIRKEAKNASQIYFATDPDREGEAISWHLFHVLGVDENSPCRIEFNEVTKKAVQAAIKNPRDFHHADDLHGLSADLYEPERRTAHQLYHPVHHVLQRRHDPHLPAAEPAGHAEHALRADFPQLYQRVQRDHHAVLLLRGAGQPPGSGRD